MDPPNDDDDIVKELVRSIDVITWAGMTIRSNSDNDLIS